MTLSPEYLMGAKALLRGLMSELTCPWCTGTIRPDEATARVNGALFHAGCAEDMHRADTEVAEVRDATA